MEKTPKKSIDLSSIEPSFKGLLGMGKDSPIQELFNYDSLEDLGARLTLVNHGVNKLAKKEIASRVPTIKSVVVGGNHTMLLAKTYKVKEK
ncbi:MAG TPA: hypothetical protein QF353_04290 [Gammaproteobacteria bacterium]|nr:hypothetical protein [Gammaproteobacteria bacterium]